METQAEFETTITRCLTEAACASIAAATKAHQSGDILQREVSPGVWSLAKPGIDLDTTGLLAILDGDFS